MTYINYNIEVTMHKNLELFKSFLKIGAFTFGGGYAMIPLLEQEIVEKHGWIKEEDIVDIIAISESTPGVIAINFATYVGYKVSGFWGSLISTIGVALPSFIFIVLISIFLNAFQGNVYIQNFLMGIKVGVVVLLFKAVLKLSKSCNKDVFSIILAGIAFIISILFDLPVILMLLCGALIGIIYGLITKKKEQKGE